jgi:hypothetical protein
MGMRSLWQYQATQRWQHKYLVQPDVFEGLGLASQAPRHLLALPHSARVRPASYAAWGPVVDLKKFKPKIRS